VRRFDPRSASPFVNKSVSEETRRAYRRAVSEFFQFAGMKHPTEVVPNDVVLWRDRLRSQKKSAATVAFKLSVVRYLLSGPDREKPEGARDYALILVMLRLSLRVSEVCSLRVSSIKWSHGRWTLRCKVKGGREETWPLPKDVKEAVDHYLSLDKKRRQISHSHGEDAPLFQPLVNYRTLTFDKPLSTRMAQKIVKRWADYSRLATSRRTTCGGLPSRGP
jgi:integrase